MKIVFAVDDKNINLFNAKQALTGHYRVFTMPSAEKMFTLLEKITPDLILLDIKMPEMDGFTAIEKLKENEVTAKIPVMFLTASIEESVKTRGFELGAVDFITKPFTTSDLLDRITVYLNKKT
jgi:putative two-component system response regulator